MKIVKGIFISFTALIILAIGGLFIFIKTFDLNRYLPQITQAAEQALGRTVHIDRADLALSWTGLAVDVSGINIAEAAQFGSQPFVNIEKAHLSLDFAPLLIQREIRFTQADVIAPKINIIRNSDGLMNVQTLSSPPLVASGSTSRRLGEDGVRGGVEGSMPSATQTPASAAVPVSSAAPSFPALSVRAITIQHALVNFIDQGSLPLNIKIPNLDAKIDGFSLSAPFAVTVDAAFLSNTNNVHATAVAALILEQMGASVRDLEIKADLAPMDSKQAQRITPALAQIPFPDAIKGVLTAKMPQIQINAKGLSGINGRVVLSDASFKFKELLNPVLANANADMILDQLDIRELVLRIGSGTITTEGQIKDYLKSQKYHFKSTVKDLAVEELIDQKAFPVEMKGKVAGEVSLDGEGFTPEAIYRHLKADGALGMTDGVIEKLNILKLILGKLDILPGLAQAIDQQLSTQLKEKLGGDNTFLDKAEAKISVANGAVNLNDVLVQSKVFELKARGTMGFDLKTAVNVDVWMAPDISEDIAKTVKPLQGLVGTDDKRLYVPGKLTGKAPALAYMPDMAYLTKNIAISEGKQQITNQLEKVLDKNPVVRSILESVLGGGKNSTEASQPSSDSQSTAGDGTSQDSSEPQTKAKTAEKLINNVLGTIFK